MVFSYTIAILLDLLQSLLGSFNDLLNSGDHAAGTAGVVDGLLALDCQTNVVDHLTGGAHLGVQECLDVVLSSQVMQSLLGEGPNGDGFWFDNTDNDNDGVVLYLEELNLI